MMNSIRLAIFAMATLYCCEHAFAQPVVFKDVKLRSNRSATDRRLVDKGASLTFDDGVDDYFAHNAVFQNVNQASLPTGLQPHLSPIASATGEIFRYVLTGASPMEFRTDHKCSDTEN